MDVEFINLSSDPNFKNARYALEFVIVSEDPSNATMTITSRKSLDDENAPGVFTVRFSGVFLLLNGIVKILIFINLFFNVWNREKLG